MRRSLFAALFCCVLGVTRAETTAPPAQTTSAPTGPSFVLLTSGQCVTPVTDSAQCDLAYQLLGDAVDPVVGGSVSEFGNYLPPGCSYMLYQSLGYLSFNTWPAANATSFCSSTRTCICIDGTGAPQPTVNPADYSLQEADFCAEPITDMTQCEGAAVALGLSPTSFHRVESSGWGHWGLLPRGCSWSPSGDSLQLNQRPAPWDVCTSSLTCVCVGQQTVPRVGVNATDYSLQTSGTCAESVTDVDECRKAAAALQDWGPRGPWPNNWWQFAASTNDDMPFGCSGTDFDALILNTRNTTQTTADSYCSTQRPCVCAGQGHVPPPWSLHTSGTCAELIQSTDECLTAARVLGDIAGRPVASVSFPTVSSGCLLYTSVTQDAYFNTGNSSALCSTQWSCICAGQTSLTLLPATTATPTSTPSSTLIPPVPAPTTTQQPACVAPSTAVPVTTPILFSLLESGNCAQTITSTSDCSAAADHMGLSYNSFKTYENTRNQVRGCRFRESSGYLYFNSYPSDPPAAYCQPGSACLCMGVASIPQPTVLARDYELVTSGQCQSFVEDLVECSAAAKALGLAVPGPPNQASKSYWPRGCSKQGTVTLNSDQDATGTCRSNKPCVCKKPPTTAAPTVAPTTMTMTTKTPQEPTTNEPTSSPTTATTTTITETAEPPKVVLTTEGLSTSEPVVSPTTITETIEPPAVVDTTQEPQQPETQSPTADNGSPGVHNPTSTATTAGLPSQDTQQPLATPSASSNSPVAVATSDNNYPATSVPQIPTGQHGTDTDHSGGQGGAQTSAPAQQHTTSAARPTQQLTTQQAIMAAITTTTTTAAGPIGPVTSSQTPELSGCSCQNGVSAAGAACSRPGAEICSSCSDGYQLADSVCRPSTCPSGQTLLDSVCVPLVDDKPNNVLLATLVVANLDLDALSAESQRQFGEAIAASIDGATFVKWQKVQESRRLLATGSYAALLAFQTLEAANAFKSEAQDSPAQILSSALNVIQQQSDQVTPAARQAMQNATIPSQTPKFTTVSTTGQTPPGSDDDNNTAVIIVAVVVSLVVVAGVAIVFVVRRRRQVRGGKPTNSINRRAQRLADKKHIQDMNTIEFTSTNAGASV